MSIEKQIEEKSCKKCLHYEMCLDNFRRAKEEGLWELTYEEEYFAHADECDFCAIGYRKQSELTPCDCCRFNPPSSGDGKPCSICPAQAK